MRQEEKTGFDVVIVGSGVAGALIGYRLASAGARVAIIEAGSRTDRNAAVTRYRAGLYARPQLTWTITMFKPVR